MTVNHGVPGSSPGEGAKLKDLIPMESGFFVFYHFEGREVYPELVEGSPGEGAVRQSLRHASPLHSVNRVQRDFLLCGGI
jgi:hypothetical protein